MVSLIRRIRNGGILRGHFGMDIFVLIAIENDAKKDSVLNEK
jgi:hypothetical protein